MTAAEQRGFTLLEMMIALTLFAMLGLAGTQLLQGMLRSSENSRLHTESLSQLQRAFALLEQDIAQAVPPPPANALAEQPTPVASSQSQLHLLRRNWLNPHGILPRTSLEPVRWAMSEEKGLQRYSENMATTYLSHQFSRINGLSLRYWSNGQWRDGWFAYYTLPEAIEITLTVAEYGQLVRIIFLTEAR